MKVLLDHNLSKLICQFLPGHLVRTARQENWSMLPDGDLLHQAEINRFDVLITADQKLVNQQNNERRRIALVVLTSNKWSLIPPMADAIRNAVERSNTGSYEVVVIPYPARPGK